MSSVARSSRQIEATTSSFEFSLASTLLATLSTLALLPLHVLVLVLATALGPRALNALSRSEVSSSSLASSTTMASLIEEQRLAKRSNSSTLLRKSASLSSSLCDFAEEPPFSFSSSDPSSGVIIDGEEDEHERDVDALFFSCPSSRRPSANSLPSARSSLFLPAVTAFDDNSAFVAPILARSPSNPLSFTFSNSASSRRSSLRSQERNRPISNCSFSSSNAYPTVPVDIECTCDIDGNDDDAIYFSTPSSRRPSGSSEADSLSSLPVSNTWHLPQKSALFRALEAASSSGSSRGSSSVPSCSCSATSSPLNSAPYTPKLSPALLSIPLPSSLVRPDLLHRHASSEPNSRVSHRKHASSSPAQQREWDWALVREKLRERAEADQVRVESDE